MWGSMHRVASLWTSWKPGIIDPVKVVRLGLENAVSVAGLLLLTEATMTDMPEPSHESRHMPGGDFGNE